MGKVRALIAVIIIAMLGMGWLSFVWEKGSALAEYNKNIKQGDTFVEEKLYDRAIAQYEAAMTYKTSRDNWEKLLNAYRLRSNEIEIYGHGAVEDYIRKLDEAVRIFGNDEKMTLELADLYIEDDDYKEAYKVLTKAKENGINSEALNNKLEQVRYTYQLESRGIKTFYPYANKEYIVTNGVQWGILNAEGEVSRAFDYTYINQSGDGNIKIVTKENDSRLYDENEKVLGIFDFAVNDAKRFSEGLVAIKNGETYSYYNSFAQKVFGEYEDAGAFKDGKAAVKKDGKWGIVNAKGEAVSEFKYDSIVLDFESKYIHNGVIVASEGGKYSFYDENLNKISDFTCDEIGVPTDDGIYAFRIGDKWGYVTADGKEIIKPEYEGAKSFSKGLAAVCINEKWGFINKNNKIVIENEFLNADYFNENGVCLVNILNINSEDQNTWAVLTLELGL